MNELQILLWGINAAIFFIIAVPILLLIIWVVNKWALKGKIKLLYRILLSIGIPLAIIGIDYASLHHSYYSTSNMNKRLQDAGIGITLPPYEIIEYKNEHVIADDFKDTYQLVFKDDDIVTKMSILDSLCNTNDKWAKRGNEYIFTTDDVENEFRDSLIVRPQKGTGTFVRYIW